MASAIKTNERPGTRAQARYVRMSASKARVVLDLIRGKHVGEASQILAFSERLAAEVIGKCLRSAVANAQHNDEIPAEELYVSACYADEGPTLKRFRPRARGRAGRIHKQTCHITLIVTRYSDDQLDELRRRAEQRGASAPTSDAAAARRRRVARSRAADDEVADQPEDTVGEDTVAEDTVAEDTVAETETASETDDTVTASDDTTDEVAADATSSGEAPSGADRAADETEETN
ncbi:MAG: 50S ribosomal protein L22 [Acidimicrobiales bacterium]